MSQQWRGQSPTQTQMRREIQGYQEELIRRAKLIQDIVDLTKGQMYVKSEDIRRVLGATYITAPNGQKYGVIPAGEDDGS